MLKFFRNLLVATLAMMFVLLPVLETPAQAASVSELTAQSIFDDLGEALNYGTVAREWEQNAHAETSACVDYMDRYDNTIFANTGSTYYHALSYRLDLHISAPQSIAGTEFALFKYENGQYVMCDGTAQTVTDTDGETSLSWEIDEELKNTRLYVFETDGAGGYVEEGEIDRNGFVMSYGPSLSSSAHNNNYLGKIVYHKQFGDGDSMGIFNTSDFSPTITFGPETRCYYKKWNQETQQNDYIVIDPNDTSMRVNNVLVNYYYTDKADFDPATDEDSLQMGYMKLDGISFHYGVFTKSGDVIGISYEEKGGYADKLLDNAAEVSRKWGNMGGGDITSLVPSETGTSTVHGPVTEDGYVVSLYDFEVGEDGIFRVKEDTGWAGIPVAENEYVIINLVCPSKDGKVFMGTGASDITYFYKEGQTQGEGVAWGSKDSNSSQRVIFNFVYADENGIMQPFEGTIEPTARHGGTLLAPNAFVELRGEVHNGAIIADKVYNGQEIHQRALAALNRSTRIVMDGGYLDLKKVSADFNYGIDIGGPLAGAVFGVYTDQACTQLVEEIVSGEDGVATSSMLASGTYYVKELKAPDGYAMGTTGGGVWGGGTVPVVAVTVEAGKTVTVDGPGVTWGFTNYGEGLFVNTVDMYAQYGDLRVEKIIADNGKPLQGVEFGIYLCSQGYGPGMQSSYTLVDTMITNRNGVAVYEHLALPGWGQYYAVKELSAPEGYKISNTGYVRVDLVADSMVTVDGNGNAEGNAFANDVIRGNMALKKVDISTGANLEGAVFTIYSDAACTEVVGTMTTKRAGDADSKRVIEGKDGLIPGTYYVKETTAPKGYLLPENPKVYPVVVRPGVMVDVVTGNEIKGAPEATGIGNAQGINFEGSKAWLDEGFENSRPSAIRVNLYRGADTNPYRSVSVSAATDWKFAFTNLPRFDEDGKEYVYTIREDLGGKVNDYYTYITTSEKDGTVTVSITNSIRKTRISGQKVWEDSVQHDPDRPGDVTFLLYQQVGDELVPVIDQWGNTMTATGSSWNGYQFEFNNLPTYDAEGNKAEYVVQEAESDRYVLVDAKYETRTEQGNTYISVTLLNRLTVPLSGTKTWQDSSNADGTRPENVNLVIYCNDVRMNPQPTVVWDKETDADVWTWKVSGLPKYDADGNACTYAAREERVPAGYQLTMGDTANDFINTKPGSIRLYKVYTNDAGGYVQLNGAEFMLYYDADCQKPVSDTVYVTAHYSNSRNGFIEITDLAPGDYYIREEKAPEGFALPVPNKPIKVTVVAGQFARVNGEHGVVINLRDSESTTIVVNKQWQGDEDKPDARPESITVQLYQNDAPMADRTLELTADAGWTGEFTKLPGKDESGNPYAYTVKETAVTPGYLSAVTGSVEEGFTITNTYNYTSIAVRKEWVGVSAQEQLPAVSVQLMANNVALDGRVAELSEKNGWAAEFTELPIKDENGQDIAYSVVETTELSDFNVSYSGDKDNGLVVTNTVAGGFITLKKVDGDNGSALSGAKFGVYTDEACTDLVAEMTTGNDGVATSSVLKAGDYYVKEIQAPQDYTIGLKDPVKVTVVKDQTVTARGDADNGDFTNLKRALVYLNKVEATYNEWGQLDANSAKPLAGAEFTIYSDSNCTQVVTVMVTDENGYAEAALIPGRQYWIKETKAPVGYAILVTGTKDFWANLGNKQQLTWGNWDQNVSGAMVNTKVESGSITLLKADAETATALAGAVFGVYNQDGSLLVEMPATDEKGASTVDNIPVGTYVVKEISAPEGYELSGESYTVTVTANATASVNNGNPVPNKAKEQFGGLKLQKVNEDGEVLAGAEFTVYSDAARTQSVAVMITDETGWAYASDLPVGTYYIKETKAPEGYMLNEETYIIAVIADTFEDVNGGMAIVNEAYPYGDLELFKTDVSGNPLSGAYFQVYDNEACEGEPVYGAETDDEGKVYAQDLPVGTYYVKEAHAPSGYLVDLTVYTVEVKAGKVAQVNDGKAIINEMEKLAGGITLLKADEAYEGLADVEFTVYSDAACTQQVAVMLTENDGTATVTGLPVGTYYVKETKAPDGYVLPDTVYTVEVVADQNALVNDGDPIINEEEQKVGDLELFKSTESGAPLSGAYFGVFVDEACTDSVAIGETDDEGKLRVTDLSVGTYYVKEIAAPDGYATDDTVYTVDVVADDVALVNDGDPIINKVELKVGGLELFKIAESGAPLGGAVFGVFGDEACTDSVASGETDDEGTLLVTGLPVGTYYVKEISAPDGYVTDDTVHTVEVIADNVAMVNGGAFIINKQAPRFGGLKLLKTNADGEPLPGAAFAVYSDAACTVIESGGLTDDNGEITVNGLPAGTYYVKETMAPDGYVLSDTVYTVEVVAGQITPVNNGDAIVNEAIVETTEISVEKAWEDDDDINGLRPESITVELLANGVVIDKIDLSAANSWKHTFTNLPVEAVYTVAEVKVDGYTGEISGDAENGFVLTNTLDAITTEVSVEKVWEDSDDINGLRPESITVELLANGVAFDEIELSEANGWKHTFTDLPVEAVYTVAEVKVDGYTGEISGDATTGFVLTNTLDAITTEVSVEKVWEDNDDINGLRPESITVELLADGVVIDTIDLNAANGWKHTFIGLPVDAVYTVAEVKVDGYTGEITGDATTGFVLTNTLDAITTEVSVEKVWEDNDDINGLRPESITVELLADGVVIEKIDLSAANSWKHTFTNLPVEAVYTVAEVKVDGYTGEISGDAATGFVLTNTLDAITTEVSVEKIWEDDDDINGLRPESITVELLADGVVIEKIDLSAANSWKHTFTDLPVEAVYTVAEVKVDGYTGEITGDAENGFVLTNTLEVETTEISVEKVWIDNDNAKGLRPESITVELLADGVVIDTIDLNAANSWKHTFIGLPVDAVYTVAEVKVDGYTGEISGDAATGFVLTNTLEVETTEISVEKVWLDDEDEKGLRPESITVELLADGVVIEKIDLSAANSWKHTFTDLPVDAVYTVAEAEVDGYTGEITGDAATGFVLTNTLEVETTEISVEKVWLDNDNAKGLRPESITVELLADGVVIGEIELIEGNDWKHTFIGLPADAEYTVAEVKVDGYTGEISGDAATGFVLTNTLEVETTEISVEKVWLDDEDEKGLRPESITVELLADGVVIEKIDLSAANSWKHTFTNLPVDAVYTVAEVEVDGYTGEITGDATTGFVLTNTLEVETTEISVEKVWLDDEDEKGLRPEHITVRLLANGLVIGEADLSEGNDWKHTFIGLPADAEYTVAEVEVDGYTGEISGDAATGFVLTNTLEEVELTAIKAEISIKKIYETRETRQNSFDIMIEGIDGAPVSVTGGTVATTPAEDRQEGTLTIEVGEFTQAGEYRYRLWEEAGTDSQVFYDGTEYEVLVTVTESGDALVAKVTCDGKTVDAANPVTFVNTREYEAANVSVPLQKMLDTSASVQQDFTFDFEVTIYEGEEMREGSVSVTVPAGSTGVTLSGDDSPLFLEGNVPSEVIYVVREVVGDVEGMTYSDATYKVELSIDYNADGTALEASSSIRKLNADGEWVEADSVTFTNAYEYIAEGELQLAARKTVNDATPGANQVYTFLLKKGGAVVASVENEGENVLFPVMSFTLDDVGATYVYEVMEEAGYDPDTTYDDTVYTVTVSVKDRGDGTLEVTPTFATGGKVVDSMTFNNTLVEAGSLRVVKVDANDSTKLLSGAEFTLFDLNGDLVDVMTTGEDGEALLENLKPGQYYARETKAPEGYDLTDERFDVTIEAGKVTLLSGAPVKNEQLGSLTVIKSDKTNPLNLLKGAVYGVFADAACTEKVGEVTTDENGAGTLVGLKPGEYYVKELKAPEGFDIDPEAYPAVVEPGKTTTSQVADYPLVGTLVISKAVEGADTDEAFQFTIALTLPDYASPADSYAATLNGENVGGVTFVVSGVERVARVTLEKDDVLTITGLPVGTRVTVTEEANLRYVTTVNGETGVSGSCVIAEGSAAVAFVNTLRSTGFAVTKVWEGVDAGAISLTIYRNGVAMDPQPAILREGNVYTVDGLPEVDENGDPIVYSAREASVPGYVTVYSNVGEHQGETDCVYSGGTITNRQVTAFAVRKVWEGLKEGEAAPAITLTLLCNGNPVNVATPAPDADGWYRYADLPAQVDGVAAVYSVQETPVDGFTTTYENTGDDASVTDMAMNGGTIVNRKVPQTGDRQPLGLWLAMMLAAIGGLGMLARSRKQRG